MEIEFKVSPERLSARLTGDFTLIEAQKCCQTLIGAVVKHKASKVLVDALGVMGNPTAFERYRYAKFLTQQVWAPENQKIASIARYAYVMQLPLRDPDKLGENVAVNRGVSVKTFETIEEAQQWLDGLRME